MMRYLLKVMVIFILLSLGASAAHASEYNDIANPAVQKAADILRSLQIMKGDDVESFKPDDPVSRAQAATVICRMLGLESAARNVGGRELFRDVPTDHWAAGYINTAYDLGIIQGENGLFRPEDEITFLQAVKMTVAALGYTKSAEQKGGFPEGYLAVASENRLLDNVPQSAYSRFNRGAFALIVYNSLDVSLMEEANAFDGSNYIVSANTILNSKLGIKKGNGLITANHNTRLYSPNSGIAKGEVEITENNGNIGVYKIGGTGADKMLGYSVEFYALNERNGEDTLISVIPRNSMKILTVNAKDIENSTTVSKLSYKAGGKTLEAYIKNGANVIRNGVFIGLTGDASVTDRLLMPDSGAVTLLNSGSGGYDSVFITDYRNLSVSDVNLNDSLVYFKENPYGISKVELDEKNSSLTFNISKNGKPIQLKDIQKDDILSIACDNNDYSNAKLIDIIVTAQKITGKVEEKSEEYLVIDGKQYEWTSELTDLPELGDEGDFYLNAEGRIAFADLVTSSAGKYACLLNVQSSSKGVETNTSEFKILDSNGDIVVLKAQERINFNGKTVNCHDAAVELYSILNAEGKQLIKYEVNADGKVSKILTAEIAPRVEDENYSGYDEDKFSLDKRAALSYKVNTPAVLGNNLYLITNDTLVFDVSDSNEDNYDVGTGASGILKDSIKYYVWVYDADEYKKAAAVLVFKDYAGDERVPWNNTIALVDKVSITVNEDGEQVLKLRALQDGKVIEKVARDMDIAEMVNNRPDPNKKLKDLKQGSIIQYTTNARGEIDLIRILYRPGYETLPEYSWYGSDINTELLTLYGTVYSRSDDSITISTDGGINGKPYSISGIMVYVYNQSAQKVDVANLSDIITVKVAGTGADRIFARAYKGNVGDIVILRK